MKYEEIERAGNKSKQKRKERNNAKTEGIREYMRGYMKKRSLVNKIRVNIGDFSEIEREFYEERAGIMEFDGGMCREDAEIEAVKLTLIVFGKT